MLCVEGFLEGRANLLGPCLDLKPLVDLAVVDAAVSELLLDGPDVAATEANDVANGLGVNVGEDVRLHVGVLGSVHSNLELVCLEYYCI